MAIITLEVLENASLDAKTLEDVMNQSAVYNGTGLVNSRLGTVLKTVAKALADAEARIDDAFTQITTGGAPLVYSGTVALLSTLVGMVDGQSVILRGYYLSGDGGGQQLIYRSTGRAGITVDDGFYFSAGGADDYFESVSKDIVNVKQFGAKGDGVANDTTKLQLAANAANTHGSIIYVPNGTYLVTANNGTTVGSGITFLASDNGVCVVIGEGPKAVIKRAATVTMASTSSLCWMAGNTGSRYVFQNIQFDGNEANCPYDAGNLFLHEQSANIKWKTGTGIPWGVTFDNVIMTGCVGDGYHANVTTEVLMINNFHAHGRTRRVRSDIDLSRIPQVYTGISNAMVDALETEPSAPAANHMVNLANVTVRGQFDLAGEASAFLNVRAVNVTALKLDGVGNSISNLYKVRGHFVNCEILGLDRIQRCQLKFSNSKLILKTISLNTAVQPISIWHDLADDYVEFDNCEFSIPAGFPITTGWYLQWSVVTNDATRRTVVRNCRVVNQLEYFATFARAGTLIVDGGELKGSISVCGIGAAAGVAKTHVRLLNPELWTGGALMTLLGAIESETQITMAGSFNAELVAAISNTTVLTTANITWINGFTGFVTSSPSARLRGVPGLTYRKAAPLTTDPVLEWTYNNANSYAATLYKPSKFNVLKGTTAARPTLGATDIGVPYLDTTLAAAGKPITWTGTAWVDGLGAAV